MARGNGKVLQIGFVTPFFQSSKSEHLGPESGKITCPIKPQACFVLKIHLDAVFPSGQRTKQDLSYNLCCEVRNLQTGISTFDKLHSFKFLQMVLKTLSWAQQKMIINQQSAIQLRQQPRRK